MVLFETLKRIFEKTKNESYVRKAVALGWISKGQYEVITGMGFAQK